MKAFALVNFVSRQLQDVDAVTWSESVLLSLLSDAQREIVRLYPPANAVHREFSCAGGTLQRVPADGVAFIRVLRNIRSSGGAGLALSTSRLQDLDTLNPYWHMGDEQGAARQWLADPRDPTVFYVYPSVQSGVKLELVYAVSPVEVQSANDVIELPDIYKPAIQYYMLAAAHAMETEAAEDAKSAQYWTLFEKSVKERMV